jgi:isopentenyldiphosphate isomerase
MHEHIAWQAYDQNGQAIQGVGAFREDFNLDTSLVMGAAHVWIWRIDITGKKEILLQKRAQDKKTWPGYLDISAAGHIDLGENPIESAIREAKEEIGLDVTSKDLYYIFSLRTPLDIAEFDTVYLYQLRQDYEFTFNDGEVDELVWVDVDEFRKMVQRPEAHNLVPQGDAYFMLLLNALDA